MDLPYSTGIIIIVIIIISPNPSPSPSPSHSPSHSPTSHSPVTKGEFFDWIRRGEHFWLKISASSETDHLCSVFPLSLID